MISDNFSINTWRGNFITNLLPEILVVIILIFFILKWIESQQRKKERKAGFSAYRDILFDKKSNLGTISDFYLELFGVLLMGKDFEKFFKYYSKWDFDVEDEYIKDIFHSVFHSRNAEKYLLFYSSFGELFQAFAEFEEILFYLQNCPSHKYLKSISVIEWGNYHLKVVNQQFYILEERTLKFINTIKKASKKEGDARFAKLDILQDEIKSYFKPICSKRHEIVHEQAFLDERLHQISATGSKLKKGKKGKIVNFEMRQSSGVDEKIKVELSKKSAEVSKELEDLIRFTNSKFNNVSEIIKDWYSTWETEYVASK